MATLSAVPPDRSERDRRRSGASRAPRGTGADRGVVVRERRRRRRTFPPRRWCSSRSTPCAPIACRSTATSAAPRRPRRPAPRRHPRRSRLHPRSAHVARSRVALHRSAAARPRRARQLRLSAREDGVASLAPLLKAAGYATGAAVSAYVLRAETGLASGFDLYEDAIDLGSGASLADQQRAGIESLRASLPWLREAAAPGPFLYWLHLYEPHAPVLAARAVPLALRLAVRRRDRRRRRCRRRVGRRAARARGLRPQPGRRPLRPRRRPRRSRRGRAWHLLYREALQIPLLVKLPGGERAGEVVERPVQLVDVLPTILDVIGLDRPAALAAARCSSVGAADEARASATRAGRSTPRPTTRASITAGASCARRSTATSTTSRDPMPELYDLSAIPPSAATCWRTSRESRPRCGRASPSGAGPAAPAPENAETRRRLEALGYLSAPARAPAATQRGDAARSQGAASGAARARGGAPPVLGRRSRRGAGAASSVWSRRSRRWSTPGRRWATSSRAAASSTKRWWRAGARSRPRARAPEQALKIAPLLLQLGRVEEASEHARSPSTRFPRPRTPCSRASRWRAATSREPSAKRARRRRLAAARSRRSSRWPRCWRPAATPTARSRSSPTRGRARSRSLPDPRPFLLRAELLRARGDAAAEPTAASSAALGAAPDAPLASRAASARRRALDRARRASPRLARASRDAVRTRSPRLEQRARQSDAGDAGRSARRILAAPRSALSPTQPRCSRPWVWSSCASATRAPPACVSSARVELEPEGANAWNLLGVARWQGARDGERRDRRLAARARARPRALGGALQPGPRRERDRSRELAREALDRFVAGARRNATAPTSRAARAALARLARAGSAG